MEIKLIYSTEGLGHQRRCEILKQKFEYLGFETSIEEIESTITYEHDTIYIYDSKEPYGIYNIGLIDFKPSTLNNNKPSIDYCVLHPHIEVLEDKFTEPTLFTYGFDNSKYDFDGQSISPDDRKNNHRVTINLIKSSHMAIVKAGLIAYETIACGIPTYVFGTDYYEWHRALELQNRGLAKIWNPEKETELPNPNDKDSWIRRFKQTRLKDGSDMIIKNLLGELI